MNEFLHDLFSSFQTVNSRYYFTQVYRNLQNYHLDQDAVIQSTENSFSAELFRHWRNLMELEENVMRYQDLALDFDVRKDFFREDIITNRTQSYRPDLVLHLSQLNWEPAFQKVYIEVKTHPRPLLKDDIQKIANAIYCLQFERGVFISVNSNLPELKELMQRIVISENRRLLAVNIEIDWSRIFLFHSTTNNGVNNISQPISFLEIIT